MDKHLNTYKIEQYIQLLCNESIILKYKIQILYKLRNYIMGINSIKISNIIINIKGQKDIFDVFIFIKFLFRKYLYIASDLLYFTLFLQIFNKVIKNFDINYKNYIIYRIQKNKIIEKLFFYCTNENCGDNNLNEFKNLNAKILIKLIKYINFKYFIHKIDTSDNNLMPMFFSEKKNVKLFALKIFVYNWKQKHNLAIQNIVIYNSNLFFCLEIFEYFNKNLNSLESIELLYYMIDILEERQLKHFFEQINLDYILLNRIHFSQQISFFIVKIFQIKNEGNLLTKNKSQNKIKNSNISDNILKIDNNIVFDLYNNKLHSNINDRVNELSNDKILLKRGKKIKKHLQFNDHFFSNIPHQDILGKKIIDILNSNISGRIIIGADKSIIEGIWINRIKRDCFRSEFDQIIKNNIIPSLSQNYNVESPKFYFIESNFIIKNDTKDSNNLCLIKIIIECKDENNKIKYSWI